MKHHEKDELSATSMYVFNMIRIPCGKHIRLGDGMGHYRVYKVGISVQQRNSSCWHNIIMREAESASDAQEHKPFSYLVREMNLLNLKE
jgi:hypothetical protein